MLITGNFNYPRVRIPEPYQEQVKREKFLYIKTFWDIYMCQHIREPTRWRGTENPNFLDISLTSEGMVNTIEMSSQLGKSDHYMV